MASRRTVDTSKMFKSMTGRSEPDAAEASASVTLTQHEGLPAPASKKKTNAAGKREKDANPLDRQTVKLGFYLTPRVYEAMQLHKAVNFIGAHNDSQIVNKALAMYLEKEIEALRSVSENMTADERMRQASVNMMTARASAE